MNNSKLWMVTFLFGDSGKQSVVWDESKIDSKMSIKKLAQDWKSDLFADKVEVSKLS